MAEETINVQNATSVEGLSKTINTLRNLPDGTYMDERQNRLSIAETFVLNDEGLRTFNYPEGYQFYARISSTYDGVEYPKGKYIYKAGKWVSDDLSDTEKVVLADGCIIVERPDGVDIRSAEPHDESSVHYVTKHEFNELGIKRVYWKDDNKLELVIELNS